MNHNCKTEKSSLTKSTPPGLRKWGLFQKELYSLWSYKCVVTILCMPYILLDVFITKPPYKKMTLGPRTPLRREQSGSAVRSSQAPVPVADSVSKEVFGSKSLIGIEKKALFMVGGKREGKTWLTSSPKCFMAYSSTPDAASGCCSLLLMLQNTTKFNSLTLFELETEPLQQNPPKQKL